MPALQIAIIGCGTAGPAAALFLARQGHNVEVFERAPSLGPVGAGILVQPTGMKVLKELGLLESVLAHGDRVERLFGHTPSGRVVLDLNYADLEPHLFGLGLHRGTLFTYLHNAMMAQQIPVHCGREIMSLRHVREATLLIDHAGGEHGPFQLVIVADGAHSHLRDTLARCRVSEYPWGAAWAIVPDESRLLDSSEFAATLHQVYEGTERFVGFLPTGQLPGHEAKPPMVSVFWSIQRDAVDEWRCRGVRAWKDEVLNMCGATQMRSRVERILEQIHDMDQLASVAYYDVRMWPWHVDNVVCLGDSAHATSPQLGQGANLALIDAKVFADCFAQHERLSEALWSYSHARRNHIRYYQMASRWLTPFFQSSLPVAWARDRVFPLICQVPITRIQMLKTLAGVKTGIVGSMEL